MLQARYAHKETQRRGIMRALMHAQRRFLGEWGVMPNNGISVQFFLFSPPLSPVSTERVFLSYMLFLIC